MELNQFEKKLLQKAQAGDPEAQYKLAGLYLSGEYGFPQDKQTAVDWYTKAARRGSKEALIMLAVEL